MTVENCRRRENSSSTGCATRSLGGHDGELKWSPAPAQFDSALGDVSGSHSAADSASKVPRAAIRITAAERLNSTLLGHSASHSERLFLPLNGPSRCRPESCSCGETRTLADVLRRFSPLRMRRHAGVNDAVIFGSSRIGGLRWCPLSENAVERASRVSVCRWHLPPRKATNARGRLLPRKRTPEAL